MTDRPDRPPAKAFSFGPFRVLPEQQLLLENGLPVKVGARVFQLLLVLLERPGEVIDKRELLSRAWSGSLVDESNLKVTVAALRRALGDTRQPRRTIVTVTGRGYRFAAPVELLEGSPTHAPAPTAQHNLPLATTRIIGRDAAIAAVLRQSGESRLLTIVGSGGIGKTTVAVAAAAAAAPAYAHGAWFVDLAPVTDPALVPTTAAAAVGLTVHSQDVTAALLAFFRDRNLLLVLDNCEHLIDAAAELAEAIVSTAAGVHILATSREPLRAGAEVVYRLGPLDTPSGSAMLTAADAMDFAAIALFVDRAARRDGGFTLNDANAPAVRDICQALDGIALAIEFAATHVAALGVNGLRGALADRFGLLGKNLRTAPARQRTLHATLDWSYRLLTERERIVLQRLAIFAGAFDLEAAIAIAAGRVLTRPLVVDALASLVAKSLISVSADPAPQYRLLETTRAFARDRLVERGAFARRALRHAAFLRNELRQAEAALRTTPGVDSLLRCAGRIDDIRAALVWAFSHDESRGIGVSLVVEAIPLWARMSLLEECREWVERALSTPPLASPLTDWDRMRLQSAFGIALLYTRGPTPSVEAALSVALALAESLNNPVHLTRVLWELAFTRLYNGHHRSALDLVARLEGVARSVKDVAAERDGQRLAAIVLHYLGHHATARAQLARLLDDDVVLEEGSRLARFLVDHRVSVLSSLAHVQFVQGFPDQARAAAAAAVRGARDRGHAVSLGTTLAMAAIPVALYRGDLAEAEHFLGMLTDLVATHGLAIWQALTDCLGHSLRIMKGDRAGVHGLRQALHSLRGSHYGLRYPAFLGVLAQGLGAIDQRGEAFDAIETALAWAKRHEDMWCLPELLRIKGWLLQLDRLPASTRAAESALVQALEVARGQNALSWELRASTDLARLWSAEGRSDEARSLLVPVSRRMTEGADTADLRAARALLRDLRRDGRNRVVTPAARRSSHRRRTKLLPVQRP